MVKNINIPVSVEGAEQARSKLDSIGRGGKELGNQFVAGEIQVSGSADKMSEKLTFLDRVIGRVHSQVYRFVASWLGLIGAQRLISWLIDRLEKIQQLQKDICDKSQEMLELGQSLEVATGTKGKQQYWSEQISGVAAAGGLKSEEIARQMMLAANAAYSKQGGIGNKNILDFVKGISPFFGAQQLSADDASKLIEFAGAAGVPADKKDFYSFVSKLQAGAKTTGAKTFGEFFTGARESLAAFIAAGGSLDKGLGLYAASRGAAGEGGAAAMMEGILKLATGLDKKEQRAVERSMKVDWSKLPLDERIDVLSKYIGGLPSQSRERILKRRGFPAETGELFDKLSGTKAAASAVDMQKYLQQTTVESEQAQAETWPTTAAGKEVVQQREETKKNDKISQRFKEWTRRFTAAESEVKRREVTGERHAVLGMIPIPKTTEIDTALVQNLLNEYDEFIKTAPEGWGKQEAIRYREGLRKTTTTFHPFHPQEFAAHRLRGEAKIASDVLDSLNYEREITHRLNKRQQQAEIPPTINIHNDHSLIFNPVVGTKAERRIGPRTDRDTGR